LHPTRGFSCAGWIDSSFDRDSDGMRLGVVWHSFIVERGDDEDIAGTRPKARGTRRSQMPIVEKATAS
jgi:hypothetical protein